MSEALIEAIEAEQAALRPLAMQAPALELESAELDRRIADIERSLWWRAGFPLRYLKRWVDDPAGMLEGRAYAVRRRRRGL